MKTECVTSKRISEKKDFLFRSFVHSPPKRRDRRTDSFFVVGMTRSLKKGPFVDPRLLKKIAYLKPGSDAVIKTWFRDCQIAPEMVGFTFGVHNGKDFVEVRVTEEMVGHYLGEFSPTRKFTRHGGKMQKELEIKQQEAQQQAAKK